MRPSQAISLSRPVRPALPPVGEAPIMIVAALAGLALLAPLVPGAPLLPAFLIAGGVAGIFFGIESPARSAAFAWSCAAVAVGARLTFGGLYAEPRLFEVVVGGGGVGGAALFAMARPTTRGGFRKTALVVAALSAPAAAIGLAFWPTVVDQPWKAAMVVAWNLAALPLAVAARRLTPLGDEIRHGV